MHTQLASTYTQLSINHIINNFYDVEYLEKDMLDEFGGIENVENLLVMNIASIPQENPQGTTLNLLAPIIFNLGNLKAGQVILSGSGYDISFPLFKKD